MLPSKRSFSSTRGCWNNFSLAQLTVSPLSNLRQLFKSPLLRYYENVWHTWWPGIWSWCGLQCVLSGSQEWAGSPLHLPGTQQQRKFLNHAKSNGGVVTFGGDVVSEYSHEFKIWEELKLKLQNGKLTRHRSKSVTGRQGDAFYIKFPKERLQKLVSNV